MAFTRAFLRGLGIEDDKVSAIIESHVEVVDQLKAQRDAFKADADKYADAQKELDGIKHDDWKTKYDALTAEFDQYKADRKAAEVKSKQTEAYRNALKEAGVSDKHLDKVMRLADVSGIEFDSEGKVKGADKLSESIRSEWSDYIATQTNTPANVATPPTNNGNNVTKEQFAKMGYQEKLKLYNENPELYNALKE